MGIRLPQQWLVTQHLLELLHSLLFIRTVSYFYLQDDSQVLKAQRLLAAPP